MSGMGEGEGVRDTKPEGEGDSTDAREGTRWRSRGGTEGGPCLPGGALVGTTKGEANLGHTLRGRLASGGDDQVWSGGSDTAGAWEAFLAGGPTGEVADEEGFGLGVVERPRLLLDPPGGETVGPALLVGHALGWSRLSCCSKER